MSRRAEGLAVLLASCLLLFGGTWSAALAQEEDEARSMALRLGWFLGKSTFLLDIGKQKPEAELSAALEARGDVLLPAEILDPRDLDSTQIEAQQEAARAVCSSPRTCRALQGVAARRSLAPRLRAIAASALAVLDSRLAPAALAMAIPDQENSVVRQLLVGQLMASLDGRYPRGSLSPNDRQIMRIARRIGMRVACDKSGVRARAKDLGEELRRLETAGKAAEALHRLGSTSLPRVCLDPYLLALASLPGPHTSTRCWRLILRRIERRLGTAYLAGSAPPSDDTRRTMLSMLEGALSRLEDRRALAHALSITRLLEAESFGRSLDDLDTRIEKGEELRFMIEALRAGLKARAAGH